MNTLPGRLKGRLTPAFRPLLDTAFSLGSRLCGRKIPWAVCFEQSREPGKIGDGSVFRALFCVSFVLLDLRN